MPLTVEQFTERVTSSGVVSNEQLRELLAGLPENAPARTDGETLARELVKQKKLTKYQAEQIYVGKGKSLTLGNYAILDKLGQGGMGVVLKAMHQRMGRLVALKVMSPAAMKSPDAVKRFQREVQAAAKLEHPNIVTAYDADEANGTHFLVMQFIEGNDLSEFVKKHGPLPAEHAIRCIIQAARGLEFAHEQGVIHRDIKPANLLIDAKGTVKILDMGLARIDGAIGGSSEGAGLTSTGAIMGTVDYMSPEQAMDTKHADGRSDIYSLGISLYYLLTGNVAYGGDTMMKKLMAHREMPIPSLVGQVENLPHAIDTAFRRMVAKKREDRLQTMTQVIAELERCLPELPTIASVSSVSSANSSASGFGAASGNELQQFVRQVSGGESTTTTQTNPSIAKGAAASPSLRDAESIALATGGGASDSQSDEAMVIEESDEPMRVSNRRRIRRVRQNAGGPRNKKLLLGGGLFAFLLLLGGLIIVITNKDGTKTTNEVPDGAKVEIVGKPIQPEPERTNPQSSGPHLPAFKNSIGMEFVKVPKGTGWLGGGDGMPGETKVEFTEDFYLGKYEVTQGEWEAITGLNPSGHGKDAVKDIPDADLKRFPVENVSWDDCQLFIKRLNDKEKDTGWVYRLPKAAEWEYACRGGAGDKFDSTFHFYFAKPTNALLPEQANFNYVLSRTCKAGSYEPNLLGLHDMHGNVKEWCDDAEKAADGASLRVARGGAFAYDIYHSMAKNHGPLSPSTQYNGLGLRLARAPSAPVGKVPDVDPKPDLPGTFTNGVGMKFIPVPKGTGWLGGWAGKPGETKVEFKDDFYLGKYEVTQGEWEGVMGANPSHFSRNGGGKDAVKDISDADLKRFPVELVSWDECQMFIERLNKLKKEAGWVYRLPKEAEWEYACRGGPVDKSESAFDFYFAKPTNTLLPKQVNFDNILKRTCQVGSYEPNLLGLFEMHGNVHELCDDASTNADGISVRVSRGGYWDYDSGYCRAAHSNAFAHSHRSLNMGLRLARVPNNMTIKADGTVPAPVATPERAVAFVESLGGKVVRDDKSPGKPVTGIDLSNTKVTDAGLKELAPLTNLNTLNLSQTQVTDAGLKELAHFKNLRILHLWRTQVTDAGLKTIAPLTNLDVLDLNGTQVTDAGLKDLAPLTNLGTLILPGTKVTNAGLKDLASHTNLRALDLRGTQVTDAGVKELQKALPKVSIVK